MIICNTGLPSTLSLKLKDMDLSVREILRTTEQGTEENSILNVAFESYVPTSLYQNSLSKGSFSFLSRIKPDSSDG